MKKIEDYTNQDVIHEFVIRFNLKEVDALKIFEDLKKWLWLKSEFQKMKKSERKFNLYIDDSIYIIDQMWHIFLLFTKDYQKFCQKFFGCFIHHNPLIIQEKNITKKKKRESTKSYKNEKIKEMELMYLFIIEKLGNKTFRRWYELYPKLYSKENISKAIKRKDFEIYS